MLRGTMVTGHGPTTSMWSTISIGGTGTNVVNNAVLLTDISADMTRGLKSDDTFAIETRFDLLPVAPGQRYGIRLSDRLIGGSGTPPDQEGDDLVEVRISAGMLW